MRLFKKDHLILVGGPSAVGKTTLLNSMQQGSSAFLFNRISGFKPLSYRYIDAVNLGDIQGTFVKRLVLHYDFIYQYSEEHGFPFISELVSQYKHVSAMMLCAPPKLLSQRMSSRIEHFETSMPHERKAIDKMHKTKAIYDDKPSLLKAYDRWLSHIEECGITAHSIINSADTYHFAWSHDKTTATNILKDTLHETANEHMKPAKIPAWRALFNT